MSIREKLLEAFDVQGEVALSGEHLAKKLDVSRVAVWKHVQALAGMGFPIQSSERAGYRLRPRFDRSLLQYAKAKHGWVIPHFFLQTRTTQWLAKEGGAAGLPQGHVWIAEIQSKGRGRLERVWESAFGGLWFSLLLRPKLPAARVPPLTLLAGLCLRDAIQTVCGVNAELKWPNDLMVGKRKLAGLLTEMSGQIDRTDWVVLGIGVNVNNSLSASLKARATSLSELTGRTWERARILEEFLNGFRPAYARFQKQGFSPFKKRFWSHLIKSQRKKGAIPEGEIVL